MDAPDQHCDRNRSGSVVTTERSRVMRARPHRGGVIAGLVLAAALAVSCSGDGAELVEGASVPTSADTAQSTEITAQPDTSSTPAPETSVATTEATASTTAPPETVPPAPLSQLVLRDGGLGEMSFGTAPDAVIEYVGGLLGAPTADTGWIDADAVVVCPGTQYRGVEWGVLRLSFGDTSSFADGRLHFTGWDYGIEGRLGEEPQGLITASGVGLGTRVDELLDAYPGAAVFEGEEGLFPPAFYVNDNFDGFLSGTEPGDIITVIFGGYRCGG